MLAAPEEGIYTAMRALLEPGDEVVVLTPCYDSLVNAAAHDRHSRVHRAGPLAPGERGWSLGLPGLEAVIEARRPRLVVVNFPHNPTGFLPTEGEHRALVEIVPPRGGVAVLRTEMYRGLELEPSSRLPCAADRYERSIVLGGLSKAHGLPGLRTGWLVLRDEALRERVVNWKHYTTICASAPSQWLAIAALRVADQLTARSVAQVRRNLALAASFFERRADAFGWRPPPVAGSVALVETRHADATEHCHRAAREAGVVLLPGSCIGAPPQFVRFGLGRASFAESLAAYDRYSSGRSPGRPGRARARSTTRARARARGHRGIVQLDEGPVSRGTRALDDLSYRPTHFPRKTGRGWVAHRLLFPLGTARRMGRRPGAFAMITATTERTDADPPRPPPSCSGSPGSPAGSRATSRRWTRAWRGQRAIASPCAACSCAARRRWRWARG